MQPKLQDVLGQPVVVENRPGAAGNVAMELVAKTAADGYTIMLGDVGSITINAAIYTDLKVKPISDFMPISVDHPHAVAAGGRSRRSRRRPSTSWSRS